MAAAVVLSALMGAAAGPRVLPWARRRQGLLNGIRVACAVLLPVPVVVALIELLAIVDVRGSWVESVLLAALLAVPLSVWGGRPLRTRVCWAAAAAAVCLMIPGGVSPVSVMGWVGVAALGIALAASSAAEKPWPSGYGMSFLPWLAVTLSLVLWRAADASGVRW